jgi:hypothetical protein
MLTASLVERRRIDGGRAIAIVPSAIVSRWEASLRGSRKSSGR